MIINLLNGDCLELLKTIPENSVDAIVTDPPYGLSFMGKKWDYDVPSVEIWKGCLRVLKPGGHLLAFAGTRTQHRMAVRIEDAGFEIRDMIAWVYGNGMPKIHDLGKAVDKLQGNKRDVVGKGKSGVKRKCMDNKFKGDYELTEGKTSFEGWANLLKPALEPITLARKPISEKTIAKNVLKWGTGGVNIDGCRVPTSDDLNGGTYSKGLPSNDGFFKGLKNKCGKEYKQPKGRYPANLIHDGSSDVLSLFPETAKGWGKATNSTKSKDSSMFGIGGVNANRYDIGSGSAARFFYCAKASKNERNAGLDNFDKKQKGTYAQDKWSRENMGNTPDSKREPVANTHPTVKPIKLMRYLCRLITPTDGIVLDPFMGSGSTGCAAKAEGFGFVGIELDKEYFEIAQARIKNQ